MRLHDEIRLEFAVPDPLDSYEAALRYGHHDLPALPRRALLAELWRAERAIARADDQPTTDLRADVAWDWWWERYEAVRFALRSLSGA